MENIITRKATLKDLERLLVFEQGVITSEQPFDPTLKEKTHYYDIPGMIAANDVELLVAEHARLVIGSGYARIETSKHYLKHSRHAYLGFMYTDPRYRGHGVNKKIIAALLNWASIKGITEIRLEVYSGNQSAIRAYEKSGFTTHMVEMRKYNDPSIQFS